MLKAFIIDFRVHLILTAIIYCFLGLLSTPYIYLVIMLFLFLIFFGLSFFVRNYSKKYSHQVFLELFTRVYFRFIFLFLGYIFFLLFSVELIKFTNNSSLETFITMIVIFLLPAIFVVFMLEFLVGLTKQTSDIDKIKSYPDKLSAYMMAGVALVSALLMPNFIFGITYSFILQISHQKILNIQDFYYLSFVINYALPIADPKVLELIKLINTDGYLRIIQIVHISICKIIELTIIATIIKNVSDIFKTKNIQ